MDHFQFTVDVWDAAGENLFERVAGINDRKLAEATYQAALTQWPNSRVVLRGRAGTVHDSGPRSVIA